MSVSVEITGLTKRFGATVAVADLDLRVEPGELFFLLGPSGCGKTTLLRTVAGFCTPDAGAIRLDGRDITGLAPAARDTAMVFQGYALWPHLSVAENVAFGLEMRRVAAAERRRRVAEALALVQLEGRATAKPHELSGGQQQRVALARALVVRPQVLLLDEPLANLDAQLRLELRQEIRRLCRAAGLTALYVTHDQKEALAVADRLAVIDRGRLLQCGTPQAVYRRPVSRFVAGFIGESNFLPATVEAVEAVGAEARLATALGPVVSRALPAAGALRVGTAVTLVLRPEVLRLEPPPPGAPNSYAASLCDSLYLGDCAQHTVRFDGAAALECKVTELRPRLLARPDAPQPVRLWFAPEDAVVVPS